MFTRRRFLLTAAALGAGVTLWYNASERRVVLLRATEDATAFSNSDTWLHIGQDDTVTVKIPSAEMGQGVYTSLAMIVADEMEADWEKVKVVPAPLNESFNNPRFSMQLTAGSTSVSAFWLPLRKVGASARGLMLAAAAKEWSVPVAELSVENGVIEHRSGKRGRFGEFAETAASLPLPEEAPLKEQAQFRYIGRPVPRLDTPGKVDGTARFGFDVQLPDMLIATVAQSPVFGGEVTRYDESAALSVDGVHAVVPVPHGMAVVGEGYWQAHKGLQALAPEFGGGDQTLDSAAVSARLRSALDEMEKPSLGDVQDILEAEYEVPFLAHATMEPMNCTVHVQAGRCEIWAPTQSPSNTAKMAVKVTGLPKEDILVYTTLVGGGFGRRGENDFVEQAVIIAKQVKKPVKLIWSREEDMQHDFYRPACVSRFQLGLDQEGRPIKWCHQFAAPSIFRRILSERLPAVVRPLPLDRVIRDRISTEGADEPLYAKGDKSVEYRDVELGIPVGFWRSVAHSYNGFFVESVIDEAAHKVGQDPFNYRRGLLEEHPRARAVLDLAAEKCGWSEPAAGRAKGLAVHKSFGSYVAQVIEISVDSDKAIKIHRVVCAIDCGLVVNPDTVKAQMEGGLLFGLAAAAMGRITVSGGRVVESNFHDYPVLRINESPPIEVYIVKSSEPPTGVGEPGTPPIAPALTNAIFAATGERIRQLPISTAGFSLQS